MYIYICIFLFTYIYIYIPTRCILMLLFKIGKLHTTMLVSCFKRKKKRKIEYRNESVYVPCTGADHDSEIQ